MKKRSTWIVFLAALLCLTMLFVSCGSNADTDDETDAVDTTETPEQTEPQETEEPEEPKAEVENVDYKGAIAKWAEYLTYMEPEARPQLNASLAFQATDTTRVDQFGDLFFVKEMVEETFYNSAKL